MRKEINNMTGVTIYKVYVLTEMQMICWALMQVLILIRGPMLLLRNDRVHVSNMIIFLSIMIYWIFINGGTLYR